MLASVFWIKSKYRGSCSGCGQFIDAGDRILFSRDIRGRDGRAVVTFCDSECLVGFCDPARIPFKIRNDYGRVRS